jgi:hypothetical protein
MVKVQSVVMTLGFAIILASTSCAWAEQEALGPTAASTPTQVAPDPAGRILPVSSTCPPTHRLKGATLPNGDRLYYEPDGRSYAKVAPDVCFTAGGDARAASFQRDWR